MSTQLEFSFDVPDGPAVVRRVRSAREKERSRVRHRAWYQENRDKILAQAGWRTDPRTAHIAEIAEHFGIPPHNVLWNIRHARAPWLSVNCYQLWRWASTEARRLRNIAAVGARQRAAKAPAPDDPILEIARATGRSVRMLRVLHTKYAVPIDSLEAYNAWKTAQKAARKAMNNRLGKRHYEANRKERLERASERIAARTPEERARRAAYKLKWTMDRYYSDPGFRLQNLIRARLKVSIAHARAKKSDRTIKLLGCSWPDLEAHLRRQFKRGMTMENMGTAWHIDHIVPVSKFDLTKREQQRLCFHYTNLQPLWGPENLSKGARFKGTHQFPLLLD